MANTTPYLTKSRYVQGITCRRWLWLGWHERLDYEEPAPGSPAAVGIELGKHAHQLFPGGVEVTEAPWQHVEAVARTRELMADPNVPAIFEAAFEYNNIRIRADVIERLEGNAWGLREVKSSTRTKPEHVDDAAIQAHVLHKIGVSVTSIELVHVNNQYQRSSGPIDWSTFFKRTDLMQDVSNVLPELREEIIEQHRVLTDNREPDIPPGPHCPDICPYWERCTAHKPADWIMKLPHMSAKKFTALQERQIERISKIPDDFDLTTIQDRIRTVIQSQKPYIAPSLAIALEDISGPVSYLDFEAMNPALPIYVGTRPYQRIPFQWSLHVRRADNAIAHHEFLGEGRDDPREAFATSLIAALGDDDTPVIVYSAYEKSVLNELARDFPHFAADIHKIIDRLVDLLAIVRANIYLASFQGSFSIKTVGPSLVPDLTYDDLENIKDGEAASIAFQQLVNGREDDIDRERIRQNLRAYCARDTLAMVRLHQALAELAVSSAKRL